MALVVHHGFRQHLQYYRLHQVLSRVIQGTRRSDQLFTLYAFHGIDVHACSDV